MRLYILLAWAALALAAGCTPQMTEDVVAGPEARCAEAQAIFATIPDPRMSDAALVVAVCADMVI